MSHLRQVDVVADIVENEEESTQRFSVLIPREVILKTSKDQLKAILQEQLKEVRLDKGMQLSQIYVRHSFVDPSIAKNFTYGDTVVEASLPYCLHLPTNYELEVHLPEEKRSALVQLQKIWTNRSPNSSEADFFHQDRETFFRNGDLITPRFPIEPQLGWEQHYEGKNVERAHDQYGIFRYSKVVIQMNTGLTAKDMDKDTGDRSRVTQVATDKALEVLNRLLDAYRHVTQEEHVERLGALNIHHIYLPKENAGFYVASMLGTGIGSAKMNHSMAQIVGIRRILDGDDKVQLSALLQLDAQASLQRHSFALAVLKSFQALELFVEDFLVVGYSTLAFPSKDIQRILDIKWRVKDRMKALLRDTTGHSATEHPNWSDWVSSHDNIRSLMVHKGREPSPQETEKALKINADLTKWMGSLSHSGTGALARSILTAKASWWSHIKRYFD